MDTFENRANQEIEMQRLAQTKTRLEVVLLKKKKNNSFKFWKDQTALIA